MNQNYKNVLTIEEQGLLKSLESTDKNECIRQLDELIMTNSTDTDGFDVMMSLLNKLTSEDLNIDIKEEIKYIEFID